MLILLYHDIVKVGTKKSLYSIDEDSFQEQIFYLKNKRYRFLSLKELVSLIIKNKSLPEKAVAITFDDGFIGQFNFGFTLLKELNIPATFFVIVGKIGQPNYIDWGMLKILKENNMDIGSHGFSHLPFDILSDREILNELRRSKETLEDNLNIPIDFFSLPRGFFKREKIKFLAKKVDFKAVCSSKIGYIDSKADLFFLQRFFLKRNTSLCNFIRIVERDPFILLSYRTNEFLKISLRRILGFKNYDKLRKLFLREEYQSF